MKRLCFVVAALVALPVFAAPHDVLFLCTGNYYRSRLAEAVFNYEAERAGLDWRARSRALKYSLLSKDELKRRISPYTVAKMKALGIPPRYASPDPRAATRADLQRTDCAVALSEREHRPYLEADFGPLTNVPLLYWHVDDIELVSADVALGTVVREVHALIAAIKSGHPPAACRRQP